MRRRARAHSLEGADVWGVLTEPSFQPPSVATGLWGRREESAGLSTHTHTGLPETRFFHLKLGIGFGVSEKLKN